MVVIDDRTHPYLTKTGDRSHLTLSLRNTFVLHCIQYQTSPASEIAEMK
ncbi:hypothetical protein JYQ62_28750 [Nostoc sp. UHCC 0702]|nr:hypothetical protein JYQ62_28750 [Nostoc sp. UHCC 0702]